MSVLGHRTLAEAERYTREADQVRLATEAVTKLEGHKQTCPNQNAQFGKNEKNKVNKSARGAP